MAVFSDAGNVVGWQALLFAVIDQGFSIELKYATTLGT